MAILQATTKEAGASDAIESSGHLGTCSALPEQKKACHQCRQATAKLGAPCGTVRSGKACPIRYCSRCLSNRYGEKSNGATEGWSCPRCRGVCNCSVCMKKRGHAPTGPLAPTAKASGFVSVIDMLRRKAASTEKAAVDKNYVEEQKKNSATRVEGASLAAPTEPAGTTTIKTSTVPLALTPTSGNSNNNNTPSTDVPIDSPAETVRDSVKVAEIKVLGKKRKVPDVIEINDDENGCWNKENVDGSPCQMQPGLAFPMIKNPRKKRITTGCADAFSCLSDAVDLPPGTCLTTVAGLDLEAEDVGPVLQFMEFCAAFGKVLELNKGQPESILRGLFRGRAVRWTSNPLVAQFHSKLLSLTRQNKTGGRPVSYSGNKSTTSWLEDIQKFIISFFNKSTRYDELDSSKRLKLMNFLCDEALGSESLRCCIDEENIKLGEKKKEARENLRIAREKEMNENQTKQNEKDGDSSTVTKTVPKLDQKPKKTQRSDAVRTSCVAIDGNGRVFWKLKGHNDGTRIVFQDIQTWDDVADQDNWFCYDGEEEKVIEKHIFSQRNWRLVRHKVMMRRALQDVSNVDEDGSI